MTVRNKRREREMEITVQNMKTDIKFSMITL